MKAAFFDVDGTLTETKVWNGLMEYFYTHRQRVIVNIVFQSYHYFLYFLHRIGLVSQVSFRETWAKNLSWYLKGYSLEQAEKIWDWVVTERISGQWRDQIVSRLKAHKSAGDLVLLVSGGPEGLLKRIAQSVGADQVVGTRHLVEDGVYSGKPPEEACQGENKVRFARRVIAEIGAEVDFSESWAYADSIGDLDLLEMVGSPVAVFPDEFLAPIAVERGWEIIDR
jgi:HAD superfamily hydrolase (TIGR01490 family)